VQPRQVLVGDGDGDTHGDGRGAAPGDGEYVGAQRKREAQVGPARCAVGPQDERGPRAQVDPRHFVSSPYRDHRPAHPVRGETARRAAGRAGADCPSTDGPPRARHLGRKARVVADGDNGRAPILAPDRTRDSRRGPRDAGSRDRVEDFSFSACSKDAPLDAGLRRRTAVGVAHGGRDARTENEHVARGAGAPPRRIAKGISRARRSARDPVALGACATRRDDDAERGDDGEGPSQRHRARWYAC